MRIGIDARAAFRYRGTGLGTYTHQLILNLSQIDKLNDYTLFYPGDGPLELDLAPGSSMSTCRFPIAFDRNEEDATIGRELARGEFTVHHVPHNGLGMPPGKSCPLVVTVHDLIPYVLPQTCSQRYLTRFLERMPHIVEAADAVITVSRHTKEDLRNLLQVPEEKLVVTYEAPEPVYRPLDKEHARAEMLKRYNLTSPFLLYVGGFSLRKNLTGLVAAYHRIVADLPDRPQLVIAGKHDANARRLMQHVEKLGLTESVIFPGFIAIDDLPALYNAALAFVYPSFYEGFGLPPLEAMACGTPVVTSSESSLPEVAGDAALTVDPYDPDQLAEALYRIASDANLRSALAKKGLIRAATFSWRKAAHQTLLVYQTIAR